MWPFKKKIWIVVITKINDELIYWNCKDRERGDKIMNQINENINNGTKTSFIAEQLIISTDQIKEVHLTYDYRRK